MTGNQEIVYFMCTSPMIRELFTKIGYDSSNLKYSTDSLDRIILDLKKTTLALNSIVTLNVATHLRTKLFAPDNTKNAKTYTHIFKCKTIFWT